jgi:Leucine-rich repeat (LRR) protein
MTHGSNPCPAKCTCTAEEKEVQCSGKELNAIPKVEGLNITTLDVSFNNISLIHPYDFDRWGQLLKFCYLSYNYINKVEISVFRKLPELSHIHLDYNLITEIDSHTFEENHKLWKLILNGNTVTLPEDTEFLNVPSLGWLELENCSIIDLPVNLFKNMSKLVAIRLSNNQIQKLHSEVFSHLKNLRHLHLEGNHIKEIDPDIFKSNHKLEWLYLRNNPLHQNQFTRKHFLRVPSLIFLDVSFCNISKTSSKCFSNLHSLMDLRLNNNILKSFNVTQIPKNLAALDISGNSITTIKATKEIIRQRMNIKYLVLTHNEFICDCHLFEVWLWCATLRNRTGGASSCENFCPVLESMTCEGKYFRSNEAPNITKHFNARNREGNYKHISSTSEEINSDYKTNSNQENDDVENVYDMPVDRDVANHTIGEYKMNDEIASSDLGSSTESKEAKKKWDIVLYSCIGIFGVICLTGAAALGIHINSHFRKSRGTKNSSSRRDSLEHVKLELMGTAEDKQETRPLSHNQGFDFVSMPTSANKRVHPGKSRTHSVNHE